MAGSFGAPTGPVYSLGLITVTTAGTPVLLSQNVPTTSGFGTSATPSPIVCNRLFIFNKGSGNLFLVHKGTTAAANNGTGVVLVVGPSSYGWIEYPQLSNPFALTNYELDTDTNGTAGYVTAIIA